MDGELNTGYSTVEDLLLVNLPDGVTLLPEDWEGKSERAWQRLTLSNQAMDNKKFPLRAFIKSKFNNGLTVLRKRKNMEQLSLLRRLRLTMDIVSDKSVTIFYIFFEYAI